MVFPRLQVVDLLDLDPAEPIQLARKLITPLLDASGPDLRRDPRLVTLRRERRPERLLGAAVHRRRVEHAAAGVERGVDDGTRCGCVAAECVPGAEPDDGPEAPLLHQPSRLRASRPAANAAAKKSGSSLAPRPMCESGSSAHASSQPATSTSSSGCSRSAVSKPFGQAATTSPL